MATQHMFHGMMHLQCVQLTLDIIKQAETPHRSDWQAHRDILPDPPGIIPPVAQKSENQTYSSSIAILYTQMQKNC